MIKIINKIWFLLIISGIITAAINGQMSQVSSAIFQAAADSVLICIGLLGPMAFWLGLMKIARKGGLIKVLSDIIRPIFKYIFPDIQHDQEALGAIILNISANILGMGNSATPLGIKAMNELQRLNPDPENASPAMCTLLALNTSGLTVIPATMIGLRAAAGSNNPAIITITTIFATIISTITALILDKTFRMFRGYKNE